MRSSRERGGGSQETSSLGHSNVSRSSEGETARVSKRSRRESRREGGTEPQESGVGKEGLVSWLRTAG